MRIYACVGARPETRAPQRTGPGPAAPAAAHPLQQPRGRRPLESIYNVRLCNLRAIVIVAAVVV